MNPPYYKPHKPHNCRRAHFHNYKALGTYMITISKDELCPPFSSLSGEVDNPAVVYSEVGRIIDFQIRSIEDWDFFSILNYVIMPDHVHILWKVERWLDHDLGHYVGLFKSRCTTNLRRAAISKASVFCNKFNDKIGFDSELIARFDKYITDNPRRRLIAMFYPHLFERMQCVEIGDKEMDLFGNFQLLQHPIITPVIVSSRYTTEEKDKWEKAWDETIRSHGALVSPFISEAERTLMDRAIEEGASIIRILPDGLPPRYKPSGKEFDLCAQGRCLHVGPPRPSRRKHQLTRRECMEYNEIAKWIASYPSEVMAVLSAR